MSVNLTPTEAAARLRMHKGSLARMRIEGRGPGYIKFGRKVLYPLAEIEKFEKAALVQREGVV